MELIRLENIYKTYRRGELEVPVLQGISLSIARGEIVALMGASGSGKTTLMNILGCLDRPSSGEYWLDGREMSRLRPNQRALVRTEKLGFVFQNFNLLPRTTALQNVLVPLEYAPHRIPRAEACRRAESLLEHMGLNDRMHHVPAKMSGGQQQRAAIGRALVNRPPLLLADEPTGNLDSHSSAEILKLFQQLNAEGITVILVTHDPQVAAYAHRTIRLVDGRIASDERQSPAAPADAAGEPPAPAAAGPPRRRRLRPSEMLAELTPPTLRTVLGALRRNKMRSALTALGIIIGVAAVITMAEIGQGSKTAIENNIIGMGANRVLVQSGAMSNAGIKQGTGTTITLTIRDVEEVARQCPSVANAVPIVGNRLQVIHGSRNWMPERLAGTTPDYLLMRNWETLQEGEMFTEHDVHSAHAVCVIGETVRRQLFEDESPIGEKVRICGVNLCVIGLLGRKGANMMGQDQDDTLLLPWTTLKFRICAGPAVTLAEPQNTVSGVNTLNSLYPGGTTFYSLPSALQTADTPQMVRFPCVDAIFFRAISVDTIPQAIDEVTDLLRQRHQLREGEPDDFIVLNLTELTDAMASASAEMGLLLFAVALISLVVGGVGIMNIMLISVTERTREIGLRMAVGARQQHILRQFLAEAMILCLLGGALGIVVGRGTSLCMRSLMHWPVELSPAAVLAAVLVSAGVGVVFGFYPAWKASRLDPIVALRYE